MTQIKKILDKQGNEVFIRTSTKAVVDENGNTAEARLQSLSSLYEALTQSELVLVSENDWPLETLSQNVIYRVAGSSSYSDYMYDGTNTKLMATYNNGVDEEPMLESDRLPTSGGVYAKLYDITYTDEDIVVDIANSTKTSGWIGSDGKWTTTTGQNCVIVPTEDFNKVRITSNSSYSTIFLFCKTKPTPSSGVSYSSVLCTGETGRRVQEENTTVNYTLPSDCTYICVGCTSASAAPDRYVPSEFAFPSGQPLSSVDRLKRIEDALFYHPSGSFEEIDLDDYEHVTSWIDSNGNFTVTSGQSTVIIPSGIYRKIKITSNANYGAYFIFCKEKPVPGSGVTWTSKLCASETGRHVQTADTTEEYTLPSDCTYIAIGINSGSGQEEGRYEPTSVEMAAESNDLVSNLTGINEKLNGLNQIKILSVGNSFSRDAFSYVPMVLKEMGINATIGILYHSSCSLQSHWDNRTSSSFYTFDYFDWANGKWIQVSSIGLDNGLSYDNWDIVTFQQNSGNSMDYSTFQPYLDDLISYVSGKLHNIKIGWLLTHAWADGYSGLTSRNITSDQMAALVRTAAESVMKNAGVDILIPYGTAVQLARGNESLAQLGSFGEMSYDGVHLQEGIGCLIASYTSAKVIAELLSAKTGIHGNKVEPNASFLSTYVIPEQHGSPVGVTDDNLLLGQKYAVQSCNNPYQK